MTDEISTLTIGPENTNKNCYYCKNCKQIPTTILNENTAEIEISNCGCKEKKVNKIKLEEYLYEINTLDNQPLCDITENHGPTKSTVYCTECEKWYCSNCLINHKKYSSNHICINSKGVIRRRCMKYRCIMSKNYDSFWKILNKSLTTEPSNEFKDLFLKLISPIPNERLDCDNILKHPWMEMDVSSNDELIKELKERELEFE